MIYKISKEALREAFFSPIGMCGEPYLLGFLTHDNRKLTPKEFELFLDDLLESAHEYTSGLCEEYEGASRG